jgi:polyisoprenoid-binding protein YceI
MRFVTSPFRLKPVRRLVQQSSLMLLAALLLAACAGAPAPVAPEPSAASVPTSTPEPPTPAPSEAPTEPPASLPATIVFAIDPAQSEARYEVGETFFQGNRFNLAIGRTNAVTGEITLDTQHPASSHIGPITIDVSQLRSDESRRDNFLRGKALKTGQFPQVTFTPTAIDGLPEALQPGQPVSFTVSGDLKIQETTRPVVFQVTASMEGSNLKGSAEAQVLMSDLGIGPIQIVMLATEDAVKLVFDFVATPA